MDYTKPWLFVDEQIDQLESRELAVGDRVNAGLLLTRVGYYRLTGYLYPFRVSSSPPDRDDAHTGRASNVYRSGTSVEHAAALIEFDRELRLLVLEAVERIELALRMRVAYTLGRVSAFAHEEVSTFVSSFTTTGQLDGDGNPILSKHALWLERVKQRRDGSDESFVSHFREKYDDRMPIWALIEILELGHVSRLYGGLRNDLATEIATAFGAPSKRHMVSWIATVNYVRNVAAHHGRLFNKKLVQVPKRPAVAATPPLAHLSEGQPKKGFGVYSALAVIAYLLRAAYLSDDWPARMAAHLRSFPDAGPLDRESMGVAEGWLDVELRRPVGEEQALDYTEV